MLNLRAPGIFIGGGCLLAQKLGKPPKDIDVWAKNDSARQQVIENLLSAGYVKKNNVYVKPGETTVDVSGVNRTPQEFLDWADFTVCQIVLVDGKLLTGSTTEDDIAAMRLRLNPVAQKQHQRIMQYDRVRKYVRKGFVPDDTLLKRPGLAERLASDRAAEASARHTAATTGFPLNPATVSAKST